jgi:hypothetical protein
MQSVLRVNRPECEDDDSSIFTVEIVNAWSHSSTNPQTFRTWSVIKNRDIRAYVYSEISQKASIIHTKNYCYFRLKRVKLSLKEAVEAHNYVRRRSCHIF